jgi:hypothetical protein
MIDTRLALQKFRKGGKGEEMKIEVSREPRRTRFQEHLSTVPNKTKRKNLHPKNQSHIFEGFNSSTTG